jgi:predicted nucleic acid-binding protein
MIFVPDASVAVKWLLPESDSAKAVALRDDYLKGIHEFHAPDTFPAEVAHALTRAERKGIISPPDAMLGLADVLSTAPEFHSYFSLLTRAVELSSQTRVGVYDCLYIALAERENCELLTADNKLVNALHRQFQFIVHLASVT